jgi:hypothetical protein
VLTRQRIVAKLTTGDAVGKTTIAAFCSFRGSETCDGIPVVIYQRQKVDFC